MIPPRGDHPVHGHFWVPIDDENCWAWSFDYQVTRPLSANGAQGDGRRPGHPRHLRAGHVPSRCQQGQRLSDRPRGAEGGPHLFSGVFGIAMQDASLQESMGPIIDRSKENLVSTDNGIIMARQRLLRAPKAMEKGETPPGVDRRASARALGRRRAAAGQALQGRRQGSPGGAEGPRARHGVVFFSPLPACGERSTVEAAGEDGRVRGLSTERIC